MDQTGIERPGIGVREEPRYLLHDPARRAYWETGGNARLSGPGRATLREIAFLATRPSSGAGEVDHGLLVRQVARYVHAAMPRGDTPGRSAPPRSLEWILSTGVGITAGVAPPDKEDESAPGWVCTNAATLASALYRELGYPVRECNLWLAQGGSRDEGFTGAVYQEAALQVWFSGQWHWVDPYYEIYDPSVTRDDASQFKVDVPCKWVGTSPPEDWTAAREGDGWELFGPDEPLGTDLQRRFHAPPPEGEGRAQPVAPWGSVRVSRLGSHVDRRGGSATSGVFIRTRAEGARLSLRDPLGRITGEGRAEIPGSLHIAAGTPTASPDPRVDNENVPTHRVGTDGFEHLETLFLGTRSLLASWEEVGAHSLELTVEGARGEVDLHLDIVRGDHPVTVHGLPPRVAPVDGRASLAFEVVIDPFDAAFHAEFERLIRSGSRSPEEYWAAADRRRAMLAGRSD